MHVGIILAAGNSSRFRSPKQLYVLNKKELVVHSTEILSSILDEVIVVTNNTCYRQIKKLFKNIPNVDVVKNNVDCRIDSIKMGLNHIDSATNVVIHDAARPFVKVDYVQKLLDSSKEYLCSQFYLKLVNGLIKTDETGTNVVDRDQYKELVTPQIIDFRLARDLFKDQITKESCEIIPILDKMKIKFNLLEGSFKDLRKVTTLEDL